VFYLQQLAVAVHSHMKRVAYEAERRRRKAPSAPPPQQPGPASRQQQHQQQHQQQGGPALSVKEPQEVPVCLSLASFRCRKWHQPRVFHLCSLRGGSHMVYSRPAVVWRSRHPHAEAACQISYP